MRKAARGARTTAWRTLAGPAATVVLCLALGRAAGADAPGTTADVSPELPAGLLRVEVGECVLEAPAAERGRLERLAERARKTLPRVEEVLGTRARAPYRLVLIPPGAATDGSLEAFDAQAPSWAAGFLIPAARTGGIRIALADRYPYDDLDSVLVHEAAHMLLYDAAGSGLPRWFGEGVATGIERSWGLRDVLVYGSSVLTGRLPRLAELDAAFDASDDRARAAYAASFDFLVWTVRTYGVDVLPDIVREARTRPFPEAWKAATGVALDRSEADWRSGSLLLYRWVPALTGTTALWTGITLLALLAGARRRARARRMLEQWREEDGPDPPEEVVH